MSIEIPMPRLSQNTEEARLIRWLVRVGDTVEKGDPLCEVESDKAIVIVESYAAGIVQELRAEAEAVIASGSVIAILKDAGEPTPRSDAGRGSEARVRLPIGEQLGAESVLSLYRRMLEIRTFEERIRYLFLEGKMPGTVHQYIGQEACAVGVCSALQEGDIITSTHRPHGHAIARGIPLEAIAAELYGKTTGCCRGKGGSMHVGDLDRGMLPAIAIVGANIPIAAGIALSFKLRGEKRVAVSFFGDGASNEGAFHEGLNAAAVYELPVVFVCENNLYGASTGVEKVMRIENIADRASAYGMRSAIADGMDVFDVYEKAREAVKLARSGEGPTLLELKTFRLCGHSRRDPNNYMGNEQKRYWNERDPLPATEHALTQLGFADRQTIEELKRQVEDRVEQAITAGQNGPNPEPEDTFRDLYVTMEVPR